MIATKERELTVLYNGKQSWEIEETADAMLTDYWL